MVNVDRIRAAASFRGVKLGKLCELLGEKSNYLGKVERGLRRMDDDQIHKIADFLNVDFDYLTGESEFMIRKTLFAPPAPKKEPRFSYDRYDERRIARHLTPDYPETQLHLPEDYWEDVRDGYRTTDESTVTRLAVLLNTTYDYLMGLTDDPKIPSDDRTGVKIRVFGDVAAGIPLKMIDNFDPEDADSLEEIDRRTAKNGTYFALKIRGDSMEPRIYDGDTVIVRYQNTAETGDIAVVAVNRDSATCKKVIYDENGGIMLMPLNAKHEPRHFTAEEILTEPVTILGKVVELRAKI